MELVEIFLRHRIFSSTHEANFFEKESARLVSTIQDTVLNGASNSLLVIGRRGSGKSHLLRKAIMRAKESPDVKKNLIEVRINGLIHTDDRIALHAIAKQLMRFCGTLTAGVLNQTANELAGSIDSEFNNENMAPSDHSRPVKTFSDQLRWLLSGIKAGDTSTKAILIILDEFDLFAAHRNQALLYNLLDCCHSGGTPLCILGMTCRLDVMEMLEKRVKSRFSHRQLHLLPLAAPLISMDGEDDNACEMGLTPFERYCKVAGSLLKIDEDEFHSFTSKAGLSHSGVSRRRLHESISAWNAHVDSFLDDDLVSDCFRQIWDVSPCVGKLRSVMAMLIAPLGGAKTRLETVDFINVVSTLRQDAKTALLPSLSILELLILTTMVKLHEINFGQPLNFENVFKEYARFCRTQCSGYLYEKSVVAKALDNLVDLELVVVGKEANLTTVSGGVGLNAASVRSTKKSVSLQLLTGLPPQLRSFQPIACFVNSPLLTSCLDSYPNCPLELVQWAHSRNL